MVRLWTVLMAGAALAGCASVDAPLLEAQAPAPPPAWTSSGTAGSGTAGGDGGTEEDDDLSAAPTGDWLAAFNDAALAELVQEAMLRNNNVLLAAATYRSATSAFRIARADLLPTLNATPSASRNAIVTDPTFAAQSGGSTVNLNLDKSELEDQFGVDRDNDGRLDGLDLDGDGFAETGLPDRRLYINNYRLAAQLSWEIDLWGRLTDETRAARKDARAAEADLKGARLSIAGAVAQGWFALIEARQQRELGDRDVEARRRNLSITERRFDSGVAASLDVRLARSALASSEANLAERQRLEKEATRRVEVLLGRYPSAELAAADALPRLEPLAGAGAPGDLLARRPDILGAELRMEASGLRARAARKQMLPSLTLTSTLSTSGPELSDVIDPERLAGSIAAGLFQPLFQGGRLMANARRQRAVAEASLLSYAQTVLEAYEEAENALTAERLLALREEAAERAYEEAAASEELTERRYATGAASIFNLLDAQTRRISAESAYLSAQRQRVANRVQLYLAIGGDFLTGAGVGADAVANSSSAAIAAGDQG